MNTIIVLKCILNIFNDVLRCACLSWVSIDPKSEEIVRVAAALEKKLNDITGNYREICSPLKISNISDCVVYKPNSKMLRFRKSLDKGGRFADFSDEMEVSEEIVPINSTN